MLEKAYIQQQKGKTPALPLWLSPTQVRIIPVTESFNDYAWKLMEELENQKIRVDIDDRPMTMSKKVRDAEKEWIPYILVIGEKETSTSVLAVRIRNTEDAAEKEKIKHMKLGELVEEIKTITKGKPFKPISLPKSLSKRPKFFG
jgi:threonyl-tRNA synthetase